MGWGNQETKKLFFNGGARCPECTTGHLRLDGYAALPGNKIVICIDCQEAFCALCGKKANKSDVQEKYFCSTCGSSG